MGTANPANLKYCVDRDPMEAAIDTEFFEGVKTIEDLDDSRLTELLEKQNSADNTTISNADLHVIIKKKLK